MSDARSSICVIEVRMEHGGREIREESENAYAIVVLAVHLLLEALELLLVAPRQLRERELETMHRRIGKARQDLQQRVEVILHSNDTVNTWDRGSVNTNKSSGQS